MSKISKVKSGNRPKICHGDTDKLKIDLPGLRQRKRACKVRNTAINGRARKRVSALPRLESNDLAFPA